MIPGGGSIPHVSVSRRAWRIVFVMLVALLLPVSVLVSGDRTASAQEFPTEITGRVLQGTEGSELPVGLEVVLLIVDEARQAIVANESTLIGTNGEFTFSGFTSGPGLTYRVAVNGENYTPSIDLVPGEDSFSDVELTYYDETISLDDIDVSTFSLWVTDIDRANRLMGVLGVITIINNGDRVWVPDLENPNLTGLDLLRFNLPEGFTDLAVESNLPAGNILEIGTGFALTNPVPPGEHDILLTFIVEYSGDSLAYPLRLPYGAGLVRILMPDGEGTVTGLGLSDPEGAIFEDTPYTVVDGRDYERGTQLDVTFGSLPTPSPIQATQNFLKGKTYIIVIAWIAGVVMLALLVYAFFFARQRGSTRQAVSAEAYPEYEGMDRAEIVETIASLDKQHDAGEIDEADYTARRAFLTEAALSASGTEDKPTCRNDGE